MFDGTTCATYVGQTATWVGQTALARQWLQGRAECVFPTWDKAKDVMPVGIRGFPPLRQKEGGPRGYLDGAPTMLS